MIYVDDTNEKLKEKYNRIVEYLNKRISEEGIVKVVKAFRASFEEKLNDIKEEYRLLNGNELQSQLPYQDYILLLHSRVYNIGPLYENNPGYNIDHLINMMIDAQFIYHCFIEDKIDLSIKREANNYEKCFNMINR